MDGEPNAKWSGIVEFLTDDERHMTDDEVAAELAARGIMVAPAIDRVLKAAQIFRAKARLEAARRDRPAFLEQLRNASVSVGQSIRETVEQLIARQSSGALQAAYFRRLEGAASEADLQQLLADLKLLEDWNNQPPQASDEL